MKRALIVGAAFIVLMGTGIVWSLSLRPATNPPPEPKPWTVAEIKKTAPTASTEVSAWPNLFGPLHISISTETGILTEWPESGPPELWRREVGLGYSSPITWGDQLIVLHRIGDEEIVECFNAETGETKWTYQYPVTYQMLGNAFRLQR